MRMSTLTTSKAFFRSMKTATTICCLSRAIEMYPFLWAVNQCQRSSSWAAARPPRQRSTQARTARTRS
ncbi:unnamed protein product [Acanthoscelides obtectus]|uniref:Uncharacterized protein n=1 Tax=Acanthoscelides obtectus TaxID=200917 RepID=A0A9P0LFX9_ACAOB|nr:unnamed protein product [Acanthoscelides obtectus]CAK1672237.1 hypothetical protein AOBTE_LOCUS28732 [Acanthoscelides obtectus]